MNFKKKLVTPLSLLALMLTGCASNDAQTPIVTNGQAETPIVTNGQAETPIVSDGQAAISNHFYATLKHTDSGLIDVKMKAPIMLDFKNRKKHPYSEFPKGLIITTIEKNGDSVTIQGDFARSYEKTQVSEIKNNVIIINYTKKNKLITNQWAKSFLPYNHQELEAIDY